MSLFKIGNINLTLRRWKKLLKWFLRCQFINIIKEETKISEYRILKALNLARQVMTKDVSEIFNETVEVDETYLDGQKKKLNF